jgi:HK97 family phage major capsid protein
MTTFICSILLATAPLLVESFGWKQTSGSYITATGEVKNQSQEPQNLQAVVKFKDADGAYIWRPGLESGQPSTILGYAVAEAPGMPDVATNTFPIAFGNWQRGYTVVDRIGTRVLRDPYTNKPYVGFYATKRVGGMVVDSEAIKILATRT